jgi:hypothetical protein
VRRAGGREGQGVSTPQGVGGGVTLCVSHTWHTLSKQSCCLSSGDVINHGKHKFWGVPGVHYHQVGAVHVCWCVCVCRVLAAVAGSLCRVPRATRASLFCRADSFTTTMCTGHGCG